MVRAIWLHPEEEMELESRRIGNSKRVYRTWRLYVDGGVRRLGRNSLVVGEVITGRESVVC